ncbi:hypothetical protein, partial [Pseudomonas sp. 10S4]
MPDVNYIVAEAEKIRRALELCDKETTPLVTKDFPAMNCKLSSLILTFHFLKKWPTIAVYGVLG